MADRKSAHSSEPACPPNRGATGGHSPPGEPTSRKVGARSDEAELYQRCYQLLISEPQRADTCVKPRRWCHFERLRRAAAKVLFHLCSAAVCGQMSSADSRSEMKRAAGCDN